MKRIKTLIHLHTDYSFDSDISPQALAEFADQNDIGCLAVTDHDTIDGALHVRSLIGPSGRTRTQVIIGEEITTRQGHLIGLFLQRSIRPGLSAADTAEAIREQGGLVLLPHPFVTAFGCGLCDESYALADQVDAVEVQNAQNLLSRPDRKAARFAKQFGLPVFVGSDSHDRKSIGPCYQVMPDFEGPRGFLAALHDAELHTGRHSLGYFVASAFRIARHYAGLSLAKGFGANAAA